MNIALIVLGTFLVAWVFTNMIAFAITQRNNHGPAVLVGIGAALIVWGIIG